MNPAPPAPPALRPGQPRPRQVARAPGAAASLAGHALVALVLVWASQRALLNDAEQPGTVSVVFAAPGEPPREAAPDPELEPASPSSPEPVLPTPPQPPRPPPRTRSASPVPRPAAPRPAWDAALDPTSFSAPPVSTPAARSFPAVPQAAAQPGPDWDRTMAAWLVARRAYPPGARSRGVEGVVTLRYRLAADGQVLEAAAEGADPELNAAAEAMLRGARPPAPGAPVSRTARIRYRLE